LGSVLYGEIQIVINRPDSDESVSWAKLTDAEHRDSTDKTNSKKAEPKVELF
jgi:hypothetical protein